MYNKNLFIELERLLRMESTYCTEDGVLLKNAIVEAALALRPELITKLLKHDGLKRNFFTEVEGVLVFDKVKFQKFVMNKRFLPDSYTSFKNKVGLTNEDGDFLSESREVVLSWPYKDCVLEGGQTKEDAKRNEVFWNEILAPDEINRLTEPKVLTNFKRYDTNGEHEVESISMDDNLIIKGNNLLALHSLKKKYAGKVKLIYIDPPYNTGSDSFGYNDSFNHSSWLTFMKNRLETAKELLKDDGVIFVQCDDNEQAYLKILMDSIFTRERFIATIVYRRRKSQANLSKNISPIHDFILCYGGSASTILNNVEADIDDSDYKNPDNDERGPYKSMPCTNKGGSKYTIVTPTGVSITDEWRFKKETYDELERNNRLIFPRGGDGKPRYKLFLADKIKEGVVANTWWDNVGSNQEASKEVEFLLGNEAFAFPKAEMLMKKIISLGSNERDIILDFHLGSGTTAAVAHKMNRRYIGIEQMDYIENISCERLKKVIEGEQGGVSKSVNWQGGGSFVYCELAKANQQFADDIEQASSSEELATIWEQMQETGFLSWKVNPKEIDVNADDFTSLAIEDQKRFLIECLDKNLLYVPYSEIDNTEFAISESDKKINNQFYQTK